MSEQQRTNFKDLRDSTKEDWDILKSELTPYKYKLHERIIEHMKTLDGDFGGFPVDRLTHSLQSATLAYDDGRDEEYVVCALLHDIGDTLGSFNHPEVAAAILKPFVSEKNYKMVLYHGLFQAHYYGHHLGLDVNARDKFKDEDFYEYTIEFCSKYDAPAFDKDMKVYDLEFFIPMLERVFTNPVNSPTKDVYKRENITQ